jgi:hypothetical protein
MRRRYASREMVGMFRAWKVRVEEDEERASRDAEVRVRQTGEWTFVWTAVLEGGWDDGLWMESRESFVEAIWERRDARSLRS